MAPILVSQHGRKGRKLYRCTHMPIQLAYTPCLASFGHALRQRQTDRQTDRSPLHAVCLIVFFGKTQNQNGAKAEVRRMVVLQNFNS